MSGVGAVWRAQFGSAERMSTSLVGACSELIAAADLMRRGLIVCRSLSPVSSYDLVVDVEGQLIRVEVRSGRRKDDGRVYCAVPDRGRFDVLAIVDQHARVEYRPKGIIPADER